MACIKCGREAVRTFCDECSAAMKQYPVKSDLAVNLPNRAEYIRSREAKKVVVVPPEVQIARLKKHILFLERVAAGLLIVIALLILTGAGIYHYNKKTTPPPGQNYSTVTQPTETQSAEPGQK